MAAGRKAIDISEWLTPENKLRIQGWCRDGLIEKQIDCCWIQLQRGAGAVNSLNKKSVTTIAKEVIAGKWGNGSDRKKKLESAGYNYNEVQKEVNRLL